jgi:hypothetical protein
MLATATGFSPPLANRSEGNDNSKSLNFGLSSDLSGISAARFVEDSLDELINYVPPRGSIDVRLEDQFLLRFLEEQLTRSCLKITKQSSLRNTTNHKP